MKTLFLCNLIPLKTGAFEAFLARFAGEVAGRGGSLVAAFAAEPAEAPARLFREAGLAWRVVPRWSDEQDRVRSRRFLRAAPGLVCRERPDVTVVHFGNELPSLAVAALCALRGCRPSWIWQQHQQVADPGVLSRRVNRLRLLAPAFDRFIAVYDGGARSLRLRGVPEAKVSVVYNGIADHVPARPRGWLRAELGLGDGEVLAVCAGSLIARKRHEFLLGALAAAAPQAPALRLLVVGAGPRDAELRRLAAALGIAGRVSWLGLRNDARDILAECDLLLHASTAETCTYVVSEAMAAKIPVLVTEAGAAREQVEDGVSGFVTARDDEGAFCARLVELASDPARRARLGAEARRRWEARYRLEVTVRQYAELLERVARTRSSGGA